jgi:hypothetical protein
MHSMHQDHHHTILRESDWTKNRHLYLGGDCVTCAVNAEGDFELDEDESAFATAFAQEDSESSLIETTSEEGTSEDSAVRKARRAAKIEKIMGAVGHEVTVWRILRNF